MSKQLLQTLLQPAGIKLNGDKPSDIQVHNRNLWKRLASDLSLGAGEGYMDGEWDCQKLDEMFFLLLSKVNVDTLPSKTYLLWLFIKNKLLNMQSPTRSKTVADVHYNLGNELYRHMLGETMAYTCGYYKDANTLDEAQYAKFDLVCRKLNLQRGEKLLDLGCGWGTFSKYAAEHYGAEVTAVNIASEQVKYGQEICAGLPVNIIQADYRDVTLYNPTALKFDKIASIGMCEHIGRRNYKHLIRIAHQNLKDDGLFLLHTIARNNSLEYIDPWINKYIFPHAILPSITKLCAAVENNFILEDYHNFGPDYDKTLMAWYDNFIKAWPELEKDYDQRFYRMWCYYLLSCAGAFRARDMQLIQLVLAPQNTTNSYTSSR